MKTLILTACLLAAAMTARAQSYRYDAPRLDQDVAQDSVTIVSVNVGTTMTQVDTPVLTGSWKVTLINYDTVNAACCSVDSTAVNTAGVARSCRKLDAYVASVSDHVNSTWVIKRWWQNLKLYCMTLAGSGTSEIRATQER